MKLWPTTGSEWARFHFVVVETFAVTMFLLSVVVNVVTRKIGRKVVRSLWQVQFDIFLPPQYRNLFDILFIASLVLLGLSAPILFKSNKQMGKTAGITAVLIFIAAFV